MLVDAGRLPPCARRSAPACRPPCWCPRCTATSPGAGPAGPSGSPRGCGGCGRRRCGRGPRGCSWPPIPTSTAHCPTGPCTRAPSSGGCDPRRASPTRWSPSRSGGCVSGQGGAAASGARRARRVGRADRRRHRRRGRRGGAAVARHRDPYRRLDHADVLARAHLLVGHCGHDTTLRALANDLPVLVLPGHRDLVHPMLGVAREAAGAGRARRRTAHPTRSPRRSRRCSAPDRTGWRRPPSGRGSGRSTGRSGGRRGRGAGAGLTTLSACGASPNIPRVISRPSALAADRRNDLTTGEPNDLLDEARARPSPRGRAAPRRRRRGRAAAGSRRSSRRQLLVGRLAVDRLAVLARTAPRPSRPP